MINSSMKGSMLRDMALLDLSVPQSDIPQQLVCSIHTMLMTCSKTMVSTCMSHQEYMYSWSRA